jgi:hypothetical protein
MPFRRRSQEETPALEPPAAPEGPQLIVLVPRAGVTSFEVHVFHEGKSAREYLQSLADSFFGLPPGIIAFWALLDPPDDVLGATEPMVLINDARNASVACPYFFTDTAASQAYANTKVNQGTDPSHVALCYALLIDLQLDEQGALSLSPAHPPYVRKSDNFRRTFGYELGRNEAPAPVPASGHARQPARERIPGQL